MNKRILKYDNGEYNFYYMFGVLEGPVDDAKDYSIGNFVMEFVVLYVIIKSKNRGVSYVLS